ncbi:MAG: hypothetical protein ACXIVQ_00230 [Acidimicrobiales bacterium]
MAGTRRYRKPLVTFEYGTRIYAPPAGEARFRVVSSDAEGRRIQRRVASEAEARQRARDLETKLARAGALRGRVGALWVRYSPSADTQGQALGDLSRASLPNDDLCNELFKALDDASHHNGELAMGLTA